MAPASPTVFDGLPLRPPTPPREADKYIDEALQFLSDSFEVEEATGDAPANPEPALVNTPPQHSPASSAVDQTNGSSRRKRVDFSPWTAYHSVNDLATSRRGLPGSPLRPLPQPRDPKTLKSILKAHEPPATQPSTPNTGHHSNTSDDFATMLDGLVKQLDGKSRLHKLDTYMALLNVLKTYDGKPDAKALAGKMELMAIYIERDMKATNSQTGGLDTQLALQALKLLVALMEIVPVAARIPEGFRVFFLDKAIDTFSDATAPKQWVNHILHAFYQQRFPRTMTTDRANRAITALKDIEDRVSGNNVVICRMLAYQTLMNQQRDVMIDRASDWIQHIFHGLLSSHKDIRTRAVELGNAAGIAIGDVPRISRVTMETLAKEIEDGKTYGDYFTDRLTEMLSKADTAQHVPYIWAAVSLLLRNRRRKLEGWKLLRKWLQVFQKCVNSSNKEVAIQANCAWNRFVYALRPDQTTSQAFRHLMRQAIVAQFDRKTSDKDAHRMKRSTFSSYCNLLYYSLPPTAPVEQLDLYWQEFVVEVIPTMIKTERKGSIMACKVLAALFKRNKSKLWKENLAVESPMVSLENIMALDPRWTRQRLRNVLPPFELCLASAPWTYNSSTEELPSEPPVKTMWTTLMSTLAEAGSKEVTASMDFKEACAQLMNLFHRLWTNYPKSLSQEDASEQSWIENFSFLVLTAVEQLGPGSFADPILSRNPAGDFEVAPTPSHRPKSRGALQSPVLHLLSLFASTSHSTINSSSILDLSEQLLELCCQAKPSRKSKLELLRNYALQSAYSSDSLFKAGVWRKCAREAKICLTTSGLPTSADRAAQSLGEEYRSVLDILTSGLSHGTEDNLNLASDLYDTFVSRVQRELGDGAGVAAVVVAITEPLAQLLESPASNYHPDAVTHFATLVLQYAEHPRSRKAVEQARRSLWGVSTGPQKPADFEPFNHLYKMIVSRLQASYENLESLRGDLVIGFSAALGALLQRWPSSFAVPLLRKIQDGIPVWVEDSGQKLAGDMVEARGGREAVYTLWEIIMDHVEQFSKHDSMLLKTLEALIVAGLRSRRQRIVNRTIEMWNKTFGAQTRLEYPPGVEKGLRRLLLIVDLQLPNFPECTGDDAESPPTFEDSQEDVVPKRQPLEFPGPSPLPRRLQDSTSSPIQSDPTPSEQRQNSSASNSRRMVKLRHDDSQIEFAQIESSPVGEAALDSQLLTDHQKEVRERQNEASAMFPDISSSPPKQITGKGLELPAYAKPGKHSILSDDVEPRSTPILNLQEYDGNQDVPSSSPTPKSRKDGRNYAPMGASYVTSSVAEALFDTDIPSSPPDLNDENDLPADSDIVKESFVENRERMTNHFGRLEEELDEEVVDQLVGDVTNLSETHLTRDERESSHVSISSRGSESELASSEIDNEVSQQLENEVIAQALRLASSSPQKQALPDDTTMDEEQGVPHTDTAGDILDDLLGDGEGISSFDDIADDLPQGTAGTVSERVQEIVLEDVHSPSPSPTEKDTSSIDLPIRSSPAKTKSRPQTIELNPLAEGSIVEDSFVALDAARNASDSSKELTVQPKQPASKASRHRKRKSETIADFSKTSKRPKKRGPQSSQQQQRSQTTGSGSDSDDSLLSNICVDISSMDEQLPVAEPSFIKAHGASRSESDQAPSKKERKGRKSAEQAAPSPRASPRLSGVAQETALTRFRKRKSRLSQSQTTELEVDEADDTIVVDQEAVEEKPGPKKKRGRTSKATDSQASSQASNAPSSVKKATGGNRPRSAASSPNQSMAAEMATEDLSRSGTPQNTSAGVRATGDVATQKKKRRRSYDKEGAGGTTGDETHADEAAAGQKDPSASQGSTTCNGNEGETGDERPKLQPKSIIERLKRVLSDCKQLVLGRTEEREIDDVMFELRREVHAAARRGDTE